MGKFSERAKYIDMYASLPSLSFGKDGKVYSRFGLLLTFLTIFIIGGMAIWIGIKIFGRQTPSFVQYELPAKVYNPSIPWNLDDFKFGISLATGDYYEDDRKVYIYGRFYNPKGTEIPTTHEKCEFDEIIPGLKFDCWSQKESTRDKTMLDVKGTWDFRAQYYFCNDPRNDCYSEADAKARLKGSVALFAYEDLLVDPFDYENPITTTQSYADAMVSLEVGTILIVELNEIEFTSDNGWIFEDKKTVTMLKPTIKLEVSYEDLLGVRILYGGTKTVYKRTYPKIQDFFAQISGFITIITPIFLILVSPYGNLRAIQHMVNEIYEIRLNHKPQKDDNSPQKPAGAKKKRSSSSKAPKTPSSSTEVAHGLSKKVVPKSSPKKGYLPPINPKSLTSAPHAALVIGGIGKLPTKQDNSPALNDTATPLRPEVSDQIPLTLDDRENPISPEKLPDEQAKAFAPEQEKHEDIEANKQIDDDQSPDEEGGASDCETEVPLRKSDPLEVPWQTWLKSFWKPNPGVQVLNKAKEHIAEAFDLVTLAKKVIEIDKMKACLFTHDQRVIFENLPSSVIVLNPDIDLKSPEAIKQYHWKDSFKGDEVALRKAYGRLKGTENQLDQLLIRLYENEYIDDGASL